MTRSLACVLFLTPLALAADPKPRLDPDGTLLPAEAVQRFGSAKFLVNNLKAAAFSPDGKTVYTISDEDPTSEHYPMTNPGLVAWEVPTGKKLWQVGIDKRFVELAADPDGKSVWVLELVEWEGTVCRWERTRYSTKDGRELGRERCDISSSGRHILHATGAFAAVEPEENHKGYRLTVWDRGGRQIAQQAFPIKFAPDFSVQWSPSGDRLFFRAGAAPDSRGYGAAFDVAKAKVLWQIETATGFDWRVSPDGEWLVGHTSEQTVRRWNAATGKEDAALAVKDMPPCGQFQWSRPYPAYHFLPNTNLLLVMIDRWNYVGVDWRQWKAVKASLKRPWDAAYSPDGKTYCAASGRHLLAHDTNTGRQLSLVPSEYTRWPAYRLTVSPTADRLIRRADGGPEIHWALSTGREVSRTSWKEIGPLIGTERGTGKYGPECNVDGVCLSPDGTKKASGERDADEGWQVVVTPATGDDARVILTRHRNNDWRYNELAFTPDSRHLIGVDPRQGIHIWDAVKGGAPRQAGFETWDSKDFNPCHCDIETHPSPDSRFVAVLERHAKPIFGRDEDVQAFWRVGVYSIPDAKLLHRFDGVGELMVFGWTQDGRVVGVANRSLFATPERGKYDLLSMDPQAKRMRVHTIDPDVRSWAVAPFGDAVAVGSSDGLRLYEASTGKLRHRFREQTRPVQVLAFSPDGRTLAAESVDGPLLLWDVRGDLTKPPKPDTAGWEQAWKALGEGGAEGGFRAVRLFALHADDGIPELKRRFAELKPPSAEAIAELVAKLDYRDYATRERAERELKAIGSAARPVVKKALAESTSEELQLRANRVLAVPTPADVLRAERAVEAVTLAGTDEAKKQLAEWATRPPTNPLTTAAKRGK